MEAEAPQHSTLYDVEDVQITKGIILDKLIRKYNCENQDSEPELLTAPLLTIGLPAEVISQSVLLRFLVEPLLDSPTPPVPSPSPSFAASFISKGFFAGAL